MAQDELVSSWLARNALTYGMKASQLSTLIFENTDLWKSDMDVYIRPDYLKKLAVKMNVEMDIIKKATFFLSCDHFYSQSGNTLQVKWVMPIGIGVKKKRCGLQFCPLCLTEDDNLPYFRKYWRLGFITVCLNHAIHLYDKCPSCHNPISLKRLKKPAAALIYHPMNMVICAKCGFDLRRGLASQASVEELEINQINFRQYTDGYGWAGIQQFQYSNLYFEGMRRLLSFLICNPKGKKLFLYLVETIKPDNTVSDEPMLKHLEPELMEVEHRRLGLLMIHYLLKDWPDRFIDACKASQTTTSQIYSPYLTFPFWMADTIKFSIKTLPPIVSKPEKEAIKNYFYVRLGRKIKDYETTQLLMDNF